MAALEARVQQAEAASAASDARAEREASEVRRLEGDLRLFYRSSQEELQAATRRYEAAAAQCTLLSYRCAKQEAALSELCTANEASARLASLFESNHAALVQLAPAATAPQGVASTTTLLLERDEAIAEAAELREALADATASLRAAQAEAAVAEVLAEVLGRVQGAAVGAAVDLTGATVKMQVRTAYDAADYLGITHSPANKYLKHAHKAGTLRICGWKPARRAGCPQACYGPADGRPDVPRPAPRANIENVRAYQKTEKGTGGIGEGAYGVVYKGRDKETGETVAIIEAMKMQNILKAERDGVVKTVSAAAGDPVAADDVLVEFE
jgi:hypothetical protein